MVHLTWKFSTREAEEEGIEAGSLSMKRMIEECPKAWNY